MVKESPSTSVSLFSSVAGSMVRAISSEVVNESSSAAVSLLASGELFCASSIPRIGSTVSEVIPVVSAPLVISPSEVTRANSGTGCPPPAAASPPAAAASNSSVGSKSSERSASWISSISAAASESSSGPAPWKMSSSMTTLLILPRSIWV